MANKIKAAVITCDVGWWVEHGEKLMAVAPVGRVVLVVGQHCFYDDTADGLTPVWLTGRLAQEAFEKHYPGVAFDCQFLTK